MNNFCHYKIIPALLNKKPATALSAAPGEHLSTKIYSLNLSIYVS